ncbi:hypothetical protein EI94DRAFT_1264992 [Lactarius quietus]|nr:hypothetical protein EI94DRAFT_1264992 [Lactarius quietus]
MNSNLDPRTSPIGATFPSPHEFRSIAGAVVGPRAANASTSTTIIVPGTSLGSSQLVPDACLSQITGLSGSGITAPSSSLPALSQLPSTVATLVPEPTPPTFTVTQRDDESEKQAREAFLESLREVPELYSLTRREIENLVSVVVREPGFPKLLEALESMWVIRGFLAQ